MTRFVSRRRRLLRLVLAASFAAPLLAAPALADSNHAAAELCSGKGLKKKAGAVVNPDRTRTRTAKCLIPGADNGNSAGATVGYVVTRGNKGTLQCTFESYNDTNVLLQSVVGTAFTTSGRRVDTIAVTTSDGSGTWAGYYLLACRIPPKSTLHTVDLNEP